MMEMPKKKAPPEQASPPERPVAQRTLTTEYKLRILQEQRAVVHDPEGVRDHVGGTVEAVDG